MQIIVETYIPFDYLIYKMKQSCDLRYDIRFYEYIGTLFDTKFLAQLRPLYNPAIGL